MARMEMMPLFGGWLVGRWTEADTERRGNYRRCAKGCWARHRAGISREPIFFFSRGTTLSMALQTNI